VCLLTEKAIPFKSIMAPFVFLSPFLWVISIPRSAGVVATIFNAAVEAVVLGMDAGVNACEEEMVAIIRAETASL